MKRLYLPLIVLLTLALISPVCASTVRCIGTSSGGDGPRAYSYGLDGLVNLTSWELGTDRDDLFTNWLQPTDWSWQILGNDLPENEQRLGYIPKTPEGQISPGPAGPCSWRIVWTGPALNGNGFVFGFDSLAPPHDTDWITSDGSAANWDALVGMGEGPIHSPTVPEPGSLAALGTGLMALIGIRRRR